MENTHRKNVPEDEPVWNEAEERELSEELEDDGEYRKLTTMEIKKLKSQGCHFIDSDVRVVDPFVVENYHNVSFSGFCVLCSAEGRAIHGDEVFSYGIYNATINNCYIGERVHIANVHDAISLYQVGDDTIIRDLGALCYKSSKPVASAETMINVLDETGHNSLPLLPFLCATDAFLAMGNDELRKQMRSDAKQLAQERAKVPHGIVTEGCRIRNVGVIENVDIYEGATIEGAKHLVSGIVHSGAYIGDDVIASNFVVGRNSRVVNRVLLDHVLVGEGCEISDGFTAHHSMFFSNCMMAGGEAIASLIGPHSVSMHKSTLLIGIMTSFFNAGSGVNQSNHLYKLGPCHYGLTERGVKMASDAYIQWPAYVGMYTTVIGRHYNHPVTKQFPFSYLVEEDGKSIVIPGRTLRSCGLVRDVVKWEQRDRRPEEPRDTLCYNWLNPVTVKAMVSASKELKKAREALESAAEGLAEEHEELSVDTSVAFFQFEGCFVKSKHFNAAIDAYDSVVTHYLIEHLLRRAASGLSLQYPQTEPVAWNDFMGLVRPTCNYTPEDECFEEEEWHFVAYTLKEVLNIDVSNIDNETLQSLAADWLQLDEQINKWYADDMENNPPVPDAVEAQFKTLLSQRRASAEKLVASFL